VNVKTRFIAETLLPTRYGKFRLRGYKHSVRGQRRQGASAVRQWQGVTHAAAVQPLHATTPLTHRTVCCVAPPPLPPHSWTGA
jgi:hypothetical protein